jgi:hypothetical protein
MVDLLAVIVALGAATLDVFQAMSLRICFQTVPLCDNGFRTWCNLPKKAS